jgi:hypothetical protein
MLSGGIDYGDLKPLCEGETVAGARGTHTGPANGLNIHNPQPGMKYSWVRHPRHDRGAAQFQEFLNWGYEPCGKDSPEMRARAGNLNFSEYGLDGFQTHGDVVLMRISEDKFRVRQEYRNNQAKAALDGSTEAYMSKGSELQGRYSYARTADGPLYYRGAGHFVGNPDQQRFSKEQES